MKRNLVLWGLLAAFCLGLSSCVTLPPSLFTGRGELKESVVEKPEKFFITDKILIIGLDGVITSDVDGGLFGEPGTVLTIKEQLKKAAEDWRIKGVILRIDSPGGGVTASDILYNEILAFKKKAEEKKEPKKVYVSMMDVAASGGYYVSMAADKVYAHPTTLTGSIGVIGMFPDLSKTAAMVGYNHRVIKSGPKKDIGSLFRPFTEEEQVLLQGIISSMYQRFVDVVKTGRPKLSREQILKLADGRVYTADEALEAGLIDGIGYLPDVIKQMKADLGLRDAYVVTYHEPLEYKATIYSRSNAPAPTTQISLFNLDQKALDFFTRPRFAYLWTP
ncbi:MAG: signal peptide peptidase SppA [bacterium]